MYDADTLNQRIDELLEQLMTTEEAAEYWGLSQDHVKRLCGDGAVTCRKRGKTWLILREQPNPKQRERNSK
jgi:excisionase family DNA binding protein